MNICSGCWMPGSFDRHACQGTFSVQHESGAVKVTCICPVEKTCRGHTPPVRNWSYPRLRNATAGV